MVKHTHPLEHKPALRACYARAIRKVHMCQHVTPAYYLWKAKIGDVLYTSGDDSGDDMKAYVVKAFLKKANKHGNDVPYYECVEIEWTRNKGQHLEPDKTVEIADSCKLIFTLATNMAIWKFVDCLGNKI